MSLPGLVKIVHPATHIVRSDQYAVEEKNAIRQDGEPGNSTIKYLPLLSAMPGTGIIL
jgi:hypothetical protein